MNSPGKPSGVVEYNVVQYGVAQYGLDRLHEWDEDRARAPLVFEPVTSDMPHETVILGMFDAE